MKNLFVFIFALFFLSGCATTQVAVKNNAKFMKYKKIYLAKAKEDPRKVIPKVERLLKRMGFEVIMYERDKPIGGVQGSGFLISDDGYLVTAAHVLNKEDKATVWISGIRHEADLIYKEESKKDTKDDSNRRKKSLKENMESSLNSENNKSIYESLNEKDLALLKIRPTDSDLKFSPLIIAAEPSYKMGNEIYTLGFPLSNLLGDTPRLNKGLIASSVGPKDNPNYLQISAEIQPGNSGGPLLNADGQVIGIIQMTLDPLGVMASTGGSLPQNVNFAFKDNVIIDFLKNCPDWGQIKTKRYGSMDFDKVKDSVAQVRSGIIPEDFKAQPKLICSVAYLSFWDMWYRFQYLDVIFYDWDTQEVLLKAGQYGDNPFTSEDGTLQKTFRDIEANMGR